LHDPSGKSVEPTSLGKEFGTDFSSPNLLAEATLVSVRVSMGEITADNVGGGLILPPVNKLFKLSKDGLYNLTAEFQVVKYRTNEPNHGLTRFKPIRLKIHHSLSPMEK